MPVDTTQETQSQTVDSSDRTRQKPFSSLRNRHSRLFGSFRVRKKRETEKQQLKDATMFEPAGFHSKIWLTDEIERQIAEAKRTQKPLYLFFLDLDNFKNYNSYYTYKGGNAMIHLLKKLPTRTEEPPARWGGDEFAQLVNEDIKIEDVAKLAQRYQETIQRLSSETLSSMKPDPNRKIEDLPDKDAPKIATLSIGIAEWQGESVEEFLEKASTAAKYSKDHGKARATVAIKNPNPAEEQPYLFIPVE